MNQIAPLITLESIVLDVDAPSRKRAFEELSLIFEKAAGVSHRDAFDALFAREKLGCTALGGGVAIPHGRLEGLDSIVIAVLRTKNPVVFDTPDNRRARLFIGILIPEGDADGYLPVLADVAGLLKDRAGKDKLLAAQTPLEVCEIISAWTPPPQAPEPPSEED